MQQLSRATQRKGKLERGAAEQRCRPSSDTTVVNERLVCDQGLRDNSVHDNYTVKDVVMWRRKRVRVAVLTVATLMWTVIEVYGFNFVTVASWTAIFLVSSLFFWANLFKLIHKEEPNMSGLEIPESLAVQMANSIRGLAEEAMRCMFKVGAESEWYVFAATVVGLWLLSIIGSVSDLLTLLYIGTVVGMTVPVIWLKYDHRIREYGDRLQMQSKKFYSMIDDKVLQKLKNKVNSPKTEAKEKKVE